MRLSKNLQALLILIILALPMQAGVIYVKASMTNGEGISWTNAYNNIFDALDAAGQNDSIVISSDTFYLEDGASGCSKLPSLISSQVSIFGSFDGDENIATFDFDDRPFLNATEAGSPCWPAPCGSSEMTVIMLSSNPRRLGAGAFLNFYSEDNSQAVVDGIFFHSGQQVISARESDVVVRNCVFEESNGTGGIISLVHSKLDLSRCSFKDNLLSASGCILYASESNVDIDQAEFRSNVSPSSAALVGSAFFFRDSTKAEIHNSLFYDNHSVAAPRHRMKVVDADTNDTLTFTNCTFSSNSLSTSADAGWYGPIQVLNSIIDNQNVVDHFSNLASTLLMEHCIVPSSYVSIPANLIAGLNVFSNESSGDLTLGSTSNAINAGDELLYGGGLGDLINNERVYDDTIDLGCFEFGAPALTSKTEESEELTEEEKSSSIVLYPNPVTDQVTIRSEDEIKGYAVTDLNGRTIMLSTNGAVTNQITVDASQLPSGVYMMQVFQVSGNESRLFVVQ